MIHFRATSYNDNAKIKIAEMGHSSFSVPRQYTDPFQVVDTRVRSSSLQRCGTNPFQWHIIHGLRLACSLEFSVFVQQFSISGVCKIEYVNFLRRVSDVYVAQRGFLPFKEGRSR